MDDATTRTSGRTVLIVAAAAAIVLLVALGAMSSARRDEPRGERPDPAPHAADRPAELAAVDPASSERARVDVAPDPRADRVLLSGVVTDASGRPVANAYLFTLDPGAAAASLPQGRTDADGRFELRGPPRDRPLALWVTHPGHDSAQRPSIAVPSLDLRVVLATANASALRVRALLADASCDAGLVVSARRSATTEERVELPRIAPDAWESAALAAGTYDVAITACGGLVAEVARVVVPQRGASADPRLEGLDLRERLACVRVRLVTDRGDALARGTLSIDGATLVADDAGRLALACVAGARLVARDRSGAEVELADGRDVRVAP